MGMRGGKKSTPKSAQPKGQKALTSFFAAKPAGSTPGSGKRPASPRPSRADAASPRADAGCEVIALDDSPARPQDGEDRLSKRARVDPEAGQADVAPSPLGELEGAEDGGQQPPAREPPAGDAADRIPGRLAARHSRFQNKLVTGYSGPRGRSAEGIVPQKHTPLELQVVELKKRNPGVVLIFEVGYKFRFFGEDAETAAAVCNIFCYPDRNFMTASIPVPRLHVYVRRLVAAGHKVGVVRQTETAAIKKAGDNRHAPFTRSLSAVYTRATLEAGALEDIGEGGGGAAPAAAAGAGADGGSWSSEGLSSYLVCLAEEPVAGSSSGDVTIGIVAVETSAGDVLYGEFRDTLMRSELEAHLLFAAPSELLVAQPVSEHTSRLLGGFSQAAAGLRAEAVDGKGQSAAQGPGEALPPLATVALAHALAYLQQFRLQAVLAQRCAFRPLRSASQIALSPNALRQLEVLRASDGGERGSLLWLLDHTKSAMGGRLLRGWVAHPLCQRERIEERLDAVGELAEGEGDEASVLGRLRACLAGLPDLERGVTRALHRTASPAELLRTLTALARLPDALRVQVAGDGSVAGVRSALLQRSLAAAASREAADAASGMLADMDAGAAERNDRVSLLRGEERWPALEAGRREAARCEAALSGLLPALAKRLRVPRLEYRSIQNQGDYLIEVDAGRTDIPKDWERVSSTKKANRFRPPEVTAAVRALELARERLAAAAEQAYAAFLGGVADVYLPFRAAASALAQLDALQSLALVSGNDGYVRPRFLEPGAGPRLHIRGGRHPVLDALLDAPYVANDTRLGGEGCPTAELITGPNMGGKSSYIRQTALIAIMAQVGCWVPAEEAVLRPIEAVHTRMGAQDDLARGRSTFLEELLETSAILAAATPASLCVIDELGRGTSTHDGLAIAHATMQALVQRGIPLLFVTHHPTVASLQEQFPGRIAPRYMSYLQDVPAAGAAAVAAGDGADAGDAGDGPPRITFLYRLVPGVADRSFGLNVARMAQLPASVIARAAVKAEAMELRTLGAEAGEEAAAGSGRAAVERLVRALWRCRDAGPAQLEQLRAQQAAARAALARA